MPTAAEPTVVSGYEARWEQHNAERRGHILQAAVALLEESPPGAEISMVRIAERAGVAKSVMYRQFAGKDELDAGSAPTYSTTSQGFSTPNSTSATDRCAKS